MTADRAPAAPTPPPESPVPPLEERLERGEIVCWSHCPFALPEGDDLRFLMAQRLSRWGHKNVSYNPHTGRVAGYRRRAVEQTNRLRRLMAAFSSAATRWLSQALPRYARGWQLDRASLRTEEEATRRLRLTARNDLLHVDAFPTRPAHGRRILRLFVNINPAEPRVWVTSETFARLLVRWGTAAGLPNPRSKWRESTWLVSSLALFRSPFAGTGPSAYDRFMLRLHDFLKVDDEFQERGPRRFWTFPPGAAWLAFTDGIAHAELRGRYALEHSYFVPAEVLALPAESPAALLDRLCSTAPRREAA